MNVLFVSETRFTQTPYRDESTRYRCYHMAEALQCAGFIADVTELDKVDLINLSRYDVVSVHQPSASRNLLKLLEACDRIGIRTVADLDALEFEPSLAAESPLANLKNNSVAQVRATYMRQKLALQHFDEVSVATNGIGRIRRAQAPAQPVYTVQNGLSNFWLSYNDLIKVKRQKSKRISYISSSHSFENEFSVAAVAIDQFLSMSTESEFNIIHALDLSDDEIEASTSPNTSYTDFMDMPRELSKSWACVAPLNKSRLNYAKPHTRFIEAAAFGVPTICSPTDDLKKHKVDGLHLVENEEQWLDALEQLSDDRYYEHCQQTLYEYARDTCLATHSVQVLIEQWNANQNRYEDETLTSLSAAS